MPERVDVAELLAPLAVPGPIASVIERFRDVAAAVPDRVAVADSGGALTYARLDRLTTALVGVLDRMLPPGDAPVGVYLGHRADAVALALAVVRSGRVLVVLDQHLPAARLRHVIEIGGIAAVVSDGGTGGEQPAELLDAGVEVLPWSVVRAAAEAFSESDLDGVDLTRGLERRGRDTAVVVFTSGSTGKPKGVIVTHDQLLNDVAHIGRAFRTTPDDRNALVFPLSFVAGTFSMYNALTSGAGLYVYDTRDDGISGFVDFVREQRLTTISCTPHLLRSIAGALGDDEILPHIRAVSTAGEAITGRDVLLMRRHLPATASYFNGTGSSEMGGIATFEIPGGAPVPDGIVPAGAVSANKEVRLVDEDGLPVAEGEAGEILVVSDYLAGGYLNDDVQTAMRFGIDADGRPTCRQGDLGRFDANGDLVLLGRADAAVKVRGYLVEPGEIEAAFLSMPDVTEAVVTTVVAPPAVTYLIAYVVTKPTVRPPSPAALRRGLRGVVPEYMIPTHIVQLPALPRNERGKVDRQQLPPVAPRTPVDEQQNARQMIMAGIWGETLGLTDIALDDDFMALGGDSLTAEEMLAAVTERFDVDLPSTQLLEYPTLREFTERVTTSAKALPSHPDVVTLRTGGTDTPVFAFAGAGALALTFLPLSRHLENRSVYAFQAHGLEQRALPDWSVESAARRYLEIIRVIQPKGPYLLVGHSFGGLVALEIADQLVSGGQEVQLVGLLDTFQPRTTGVMPELEFQKLAPRSSGPTPLDRVGRLLRSAVARVLPDGLPAARQVGERVRARAAGLVQFGGQMQFDAFFDHATLAGRKYRLKPYGGRVLFVLAEGNPDGPDAWRSVLSGPSSFVEIAAEHSSLLREPHATELAAVLHEAIRQA